MKKDIKIAVILIVFLSAILMVLIYFRYFKSDEGAKNTTELTEEERQENEEILEEMQLAMEAENASDGAISASGTAASSETNSLINRSYTITFRGITFKMPAFTNRLPESGVGGDEEKTTINVSFFPEVTGANVKSVTYTVDNGAFYPLTELNEEEAEAAINGTADQRYADVVKKDCIIGENLDHGEEKCKYTGLQNKRYWGVSKERQKSITIPVNDPNSQRGYYRLQFHKEDVALAEETSLQKFRTMADLVGASPIRITLTLKSGSPITKTLRFHPVKSTTSDLYILQYTLT